MIFEIGKYYKHTTGEMLHIISAGKTTLYGWTMIAETTRGSNLVTVGVGESFAVNWSESTEEEWLSHFS